MRRAPILLIGIAVFSVRLLAQMPANPSFEVASVKPNKSDAIVQLGAPQPGGRFVITNTPLLAIIRNAYQLQLFQILNVPDWVRTERFDITAKAASDQSSVSPLLMLRSLLAERFKLQTHTETREMPTYHLVMAHPDGQPGINLTPPKIDCAAVVAGRLPAPPPAKAGQRTQCGLAMGLGNIAGGSIAMAQLATVLTMRLSRVVVDRTQLQGKWDLFVAFSPDQLPPIPPGSLPPGEPPIDPNAPPLFTALEEQLGLKLESVKGPAVDVLVIDHVERPTDN